MPTLSCPQFVDTECVLSTGDRHHQPWSHTPAIPAHRTGRQEDEIKVILDSEVKNEGAEALSNIPPATHTAESSLREYLTLLSSLPAVMHAA